MSSIIHGVTDTLAQREAEAQTCSVPDCDRIWSTLWDGVLYCAGHVADLRFGGGR